MRLANRRGFIVEYLCAARAYTAGSIPNTSVGFYGCPQGLIPQVPGNIPIPRNYKMAATSKLPTTKIRCIDSTECQNSAHSRQLTASGLRVKHQAERNRS